MGACLLLFFVVPASANRLWSSGFELNSLSSGDEWKTKTGSPTISTSIVRSGAYSMEADATSAQYVTHRWNTDNDAGPVFFRFYLRVERFPPNGTNSTLVALENTGGTDKIRLRLNDNNKLNLYNNEDSVSIGNNSSKLDSNQWYRVELSYYATTIGSDFNANVRAVLDGNVFADGNAVLNNPPAQFSLGCTNNCSLKAFFDDVAINDSNGTSQNGFPGNGKIIHLRPNANGDSIQWNLGQPDNSNHFSDVNEIAPDDGTSYIEDLNASQNHLDEFQLTNASIPSDSNVLVVAVGYRANVQSTSNNRYKLRLKSQTNGTALESGTIGPQDSGSYRTNNGSSGNNTMNYLLTATTKPDSSNPWTAGDLNNSQIGIQNTGATANWIRATTMWLLVEYTEATPNQSPDINLLKIDGFFDNLSLPPFSYQRDSNLTIDFNVQDSDSNNLKLDLNFSVSNIQGTGQAIAQQLDLNQLGTSGPFRCDQTDFRSSTNCSIDWNILSVPDGNYFLLIRVTDSNSTDFAASDNNFMIDNSLPTTAWDGNGSWQKTDANIHLACSDSSGSGCSVTKYRLDTDSSSIVSYGSWTTHDTNILIRSDGNWALDFNSSDNAGNIENTNLVFVLIDQNRPTVLITTPAEGGTITSSTVVIQYQGSDSLSGIAKYWVSSNGNEWIDNNQNQSHSFESQSNGIHTYWVRAADFADNNSPDANVTVTVFVSDNSQQQQGGGYPACQPYPYNSNTDICGLSETCPGEWLPASDTERCCSIACQATPETSETVLESSLEPFGATPLFVLDKSVSELALESLRLASAQELAFSRKLASQPFVAANGSQLFKNTLFLTVKNTSGGSLENAQVMESIPKSIVQHVSEITQETVFETVQADPVIRFSLGSLSFGEQKTVSYSIVKTEAITAQQFGLFEAPVGIVKLLPNELCANVECADKNPCTEDVCVAGTCRFLKMKNGAVCGSQQQCQDGECVSDSSITGLATIGKEQQKPVEQAQSLYNSVVLGTLIVTLLAGFWLGRKQMKNSKRWGS